MPTPHFARAEFECPHCNVALVRPRLIQCLELARAAAGGQPIRIISGYRCPVHNRAVGGAPDSQHMYAAAADIRPGTMHMRVAKASGFTGVGTKGGWPVHVDVRDGPFTTWVY